MSRPYSVKNVRQVEVRLENTSSSLTPDQLQRSAGEDVAVFCRYQGGSAILHGVLRAGVLHNPIYKETQVSLVITGDPQMGTIGTVNGVEIRPGNKVSLVLYGEGPLFEIENIFIGDL